tara:strand:- start:138 stop:446 length:309 start_codon:yes stop_codon:yes gene_type:complete
MSKLTKKILQNKNNVNIAENNLFVLSGDEEELTPYDMDGMPEFENDKNDAYATIFCRFRNEEDLRKFANLVEQKSINKKTKSIWYPMLGPSAASLSRWVDEE